MGRVSACIEQQNLKGTLAKDEVNEHLQHEYSLPVEEMLFMYTIRYDSDLQAKKNTTSRGGQVVKKQYHQ